MAIKGLWATKNEQKRWFSQRSWDLLGRNKEGWVETPDSVMENKVGKDAITKPATGQGNNKSTQVIDNKANKAKADSKPVTKEKKNEFLKAVDGISKTAIKDFFDAQFPAVGYSNTANEQELRKQLGEHLNWDIVEFQKSFA